MKQDAHIDQFQFLKSCNTLIIEDNDTLEIKPKATSFKLPNINKDLIFSLGFDEHFVKEYFKSIEKDEKVKIKSKTTEISTAYLLRRKGCDYQIEPKINNKTPDFLVDGSLVIECFCTSEETNEARDLAWSIKHKEVLKEIRDYFKKENDVSFSVSFNANKINEWQNKYYESLHSRGEVKERLECDITKEIKDLVSNAILEDKDSVDGELVNISIDKHSHDSVGGFLTPDRIIQKIKSKLEKYTKVTSKPILLIMSSYDNMVSDETILSSIYGHISVPISIDANSNFIQSGSARRKEFLGCNKLHKEIEKKEQIAGIAWMEIDGNNVTINLFENKNQDYEVVFI
ncbi:hypothetical protein [Vibrio parahaemolyticus]|uniref:hypothetical protein n=1 Tax=Vibrio parahaemolyticus TaxID=670 RepID=UPI001E46F89A|nr:hypothetical protein [Vibrio parahaemolyticus]